MGSDNNCCSNNRVYQEEQDSEIITDGNNSEIHKCKENKKVKKFIPSQKILDDTSSYSSHSETIFREYKAPSKIRKIKKLQKFFRNMIEKNKYIKYNQERKIQVKKELQKYIINPKFLSSHKGEILHNKFKRLYPKAILDYSKKAKLYNKYTFTINNYIQLNKNEIYIGSWNINKLYYGYGILYITTPNNQKKYEGIFNNGKLESFSYEINPNTDLIYLGNWENNLKMGEGQEVYLGNNIDHYYSFKGKFINNSKIYGRLNWRDGSYYEGSFNENDKFNGKGIYFWGNTKEKYDGEWFKGEMNGQGKMYYSDGSFYEGQFFYNKKQGYGKYIWGGNIKKYYCGEWKNDFMDGKGKYVFGDIVKEGLWNKGQFVEINTN